MCLPARGYFCLRLGGIGPTTEPTASILCMRCAGSFSGVLCNCCRSSSEGQEKGSKHGPEKDVVTGSAISFSSSSSTPSPSVARSSPPLLALTVNPPCSRVTLSSEVSTLSLQYSQPAILCSPAENTPPSVCLRNICTHRKSGSSLLRSRRHVFASFITLPNKSAHKHPRWNSHHATLPAHESNARGADGLLPDQATRVPTGTTAPTSAARGSRATRPTTPSSARGAWPTPPTPPMATAPTTRSASALAPLARSAPANGSRYASRLSRQRNVSGCVLTRH